MTLICNFLTAGGRHRVTANERMRAYVCCHAGHNASRTSRNKKTKKKFETSFSSRAFVIRIHIGNVANEKNYIRLLSRSTCSARTFLSLIFLCALWSRRKHFPSALVMFAQMKCQTHAKFEALASIVLVSAMHEKIGRQQTKYSHSVRDDTVDFMPSRYVGQKNKFYNFIFMLAVVAAAAMVQRID